MNILAGILLIAFAILVIGFIILALDKRQRRGGSRGYYSSGSSFTFFDFGGDSGGDCGGDGGGGCD
jgi:hypothetical protein